MTTCNNEVLKFQNDVIVNNAVDEWMLKVIVQMQKSNRLLIKKAILDLGNTSCSSDRSGWINSFPESVCLTADDVWWTVEVEHVLNEINSVSKTKSHTCDGVRGSFVSRPRLESYVINLELHWRMGERDGYPFSFDSIAARLSREPAPSCRFSPRAYRNKTIDNNAPASVLQGDGLGMKRYFNELNRKIDETVTRIKKEMSENTRKKYSSALISYVHHRDVVESFIVNK